MTALGHPADTHLKHEKHHIGKCAESSSKNVYLRNAARLAEVPMKILVSMFVTEDVESKPTVGRMPELKVFRNPARES